jgi:hypothetical protein
MSVSVVPSSPKLPTPVVFKKYDEVSRKRLIVSVEGLHANGKTNFALTAPGPIGILNFDDGLEGVVEKFQDKKDIFVFNFQIPQSLALPGTAVGDTLADRAKKVWEDFVITYRECLQRMRSVVIDTNSEAWELVRIARLGKLASVLPHQYVAVNAEFRELLRLGYRHDANVILLHKLKKHYENEKFTGNYERAGFGDTDFVVQNSFRCSKDPKAEGYNKFNLKISKCRQNPLLEEVVLTGEECNFSKVAAMVTGSGEEEWK